jgi:hypothetical protein
LEVETLPFLPYKALNIEVQVEVEIFTI